MLTIEDIENIGGKEMLSFYSSDKDCYSRIVRLSDEGKIVYPLN